MVYEKDDDVNEGVISSDGSPGDDWLGFAMAVVPGVGSEKGSGEPTNNPFASVVRCWTGEFCWGPSKCCRSVGRIVLEAGASPQLAK